MKKLIFFLTVVCLMSNYTTTRADTTDTLYPGDALYNGEYIQSINGTYRLSLEEDGNVIFMDRKNDRTIWETGTIGTLANRFKLQRDGNLVLYSPAKALWASKTVNSGATHLSITDDGLLALYSNESVLWFVDSPENLHHGNSLYPGDTLYNGEYIESNNGQYRLSLEYDGNIIFSDWDNNRVLWETGTSDTLAERFKLQRDDNLVLYAPAKALWASKTVNSGATHLSITDDGLLALYSGESVLWFRGDYTNMPTGLLVELASTKKDIVVIFDFDDTLLDHSTEDWAAYTRSGLNYLKSYGINIGICSANEGTEALARRLQRLDDELFSDAFLSSDAFQTASRGGISKEKWDEIQIIMDYYNVTSGKGVVFYDDKDYNIDPVVDELGVHGVLLGEDALTRPDFRDGIIQLITYISGEK